MKRSCNEKVRAEVLESEESGIPIRLKPSRRAQTQTLVGHRSKPLKNNTQKSAKFTESGQQSAERRRRQSAKLNVNRLQKDF